MSERLIFCLNEGERFPASEFRQINGRVVIPEVHMTEFPHYASNGQPWHGRDEPPPIFDLTDRRDPE